MVPIPQPEKVQISEVQGSQCTIIELKVAKSEVGKIIGRNGRMAQAIRTILQAGSSRLNRRMVLEIIEEKNEPFRRAHERRRQAILIEVKRKAPSFAQDTTWRTI